MKAEKLGTLESIMFNENGISGTGFLSMPDHVPTGIVTHVVGQFRGFGNVPDHEIRILPDFKGPDSIQKPYSFGVPLRLPNSRSAIAYHILFSRLAYQ